MGMVTSCVHQRTAHKGAIVVTIGFDALDFDCGTLIFSVVFGNSILKKFKL